MVFNRSEASPNHGFGSVFIGNGRDRSRSEWVPTHKIRTNFDFEENVIGGEVSGEADLRILLLVDLFVLESLDHGLGNRIAGAEAVFGKSRDAVESLAVMPVLYGLTFVFRALGLSYQEVAIALIGDDHSN